MSKIAILGAGMVGRTIAIDLNENGHNVTSFDINVDNLNKLSTHEKIEIKQVDFTSMNYEFYLNEFDLIVNAVPGFIGYRVLKNIIEGAKKNCVDISFFPEKIDELDALAKENGVFAIMDCGIAPGMSNLILGRESQNMKVEFFKFYVGGLPQERILPFEYKAPYSPVDVIEFNIRPARMRINGRNVKASPLSEVEKINFRNVGTLEAFNTDGLRNLLDSFPDIPNMIEKTLRYPGYAEKITMLKSMGFFNKENINNTAKVLIDAWKSSPEDKDFVAMTVMIAGKDNEDNRKTVTYNLLDYHDGEFSAMSRTTAYTCTAMVRWVLDNQVELGVYSPEVIGKSEAAFNSIMEHLKDKNVKWERNG